MKRSRRRLALTAFVSSLALILGFGRSSVDAWAQGPLPSRVSPTEPPAHPAGITELSRLFDTPPDDARIMMRWWWFGPSVTKPQLEREMRLMKEGGIGGFEVQPVYPLALDDAASGIKNLPYLSDEFIDALRFTSDKARELGLRMDLTVGSGWPFGGPMVPVADASARLRVERVKVAAGATRIPLPPMADGETLIAAFTARLQGPALAAGSVQEATDLRDGALFLKGAAQTPDEVQFFIQSRTGMMVKRAAVGAEGFVLNHFDRGAAERYLKNVGDRLMQAFGPRPPYAIFCDSLEVYGGDWNADLLPEFQKRRGYDLRPHLPALTAFIGPSTTGIRRDWGRTLSELVEERFLAPLKEWSARNRTLLRIQGYGIPPMTLSGNKFADLSEGEGHHWKILRASRWASSANHLYGQTVTSSETWTWLHTPSFRATPLDIKAEADLHFLQGINQLIGHGWPYTAPGIEYPGWRFYAAGVFNDKNPWWIAMPDVARYLQRMSFILRQGQPRNDIAVYLPNDDAWSEFTTGGNINLITTLSARLGTEVVAKILEAGFNIDFVDDEAILKLGRFESGKLVLGENRYSAVVLPGVQRIPADTYRKLGAFARAGGAVIATRTRPSIAPGFLAKEPEHAEIRAISERLFESGAGLSSYVEDEAKSLGGALTRVLQPDVAFTPAVADLGFVHRSTSDAEIYFVANTSNERQVVKATFRVAPSQAESWDPMTGRVSPLTAHATPKGGTTPGATVSLDLPAYGSQVVVFSKRVLPRAKTFAKKPLPAPLDWSQGWTIAFGPEGPKTSVDQLRSWADSEATRYFSGVATYEKTVTVPKEWLARADLALRIDFGEAKPIPTGGPRARQQAWLEAPVREAAVVYVNGRRAGSVWSPPYSLDVTSLLRAGENTLRIEVGNLAMNSMAGRALPDYKLLNLRYGVRFEAQDMDKVQVVPSGLLGGVRLVAASK
jgi:hypothetical protein